MEVNLNKLIGLKIPLEGFMIMHLLHSEEREILSSYVVNVRKIPTEVFQDLVNKGYLINSSEDPASFTIDSIELTDKFKSEILKVPSVKGVTFDQAFEQVREHFPSKVTDPAGGVRRLQSDIDRCKKLYKAVIISSGEVDEELHKLILLCIDLEKSERVRSRSVQYWKLLPTYLSQKGWEVYMEDVKELMKKNGTVQNVSEGFAEDI